MRGDRAYRPDTFPINSNVVDDGVELRANPVVLPLGKDHRPAMVALFKCLQDLGRVVSLVPEGLDRAGLAIVERPNWLWSKWVCGRQGSKSYQDSLGENGKHGSR